MKLELCNEVLELRPEKAIYWPKEKLLAFSDVHIGKAESLQKLGIPLPTGPHLEDLAKIRSLIHETRPEKIFILGDLIHQKSSWAPHIISDLKKFFAEHAHIQWHLVIGNHDKGSMSYLSQLPIKLIEEFTFIEPFLFTHGHLELESFTNNRQGFEIRGHVHPAIRIKEGSTQLRLPCFVYEKNSLTLPSFGILTGGAEVTKTAKNRIFAVAETSLFEVSK